MSKQSSVQAKSTISPGLTRSSASLMERQHTLGPHVCVQREAVGPAVHPAAPSLVREVVESPGSPLDAATRSDMEPRFGYDFSQVRVHADDKAAESARAVNANAYTAQNHVAFGAGQYAPASPSGQRLLAHELTHVVQQASGPIEGTLVGEGLSVSHPTDSFERHAAANATRVSADRRNVAEPIRQRAQAQSENGAIHVQRDAPADVGDTPSARKSATAAEVSAGTGIFSAAVGAFTGLVGAYAAVRSANFAERSAQAAEDPPTAEPTTGGVAITDADIPEIKGLDYKEIGEKGKEPDTETKTETTEVEDVETTEKKTKTKTKTQPTKTTAKTSTSKVFKPKDKTDRLDTYHVLNVNQGPGDSADFYVSIRSNGQDIKDGGTEPPESTGYLGGTSHANASVVFKARPGAHDENGNASVRLSVGGTNTPPRKFPQGSGFFGGGGPKANENYNVQRFGGAITFFADPGKNPVVDKRLLKPEYAPAAKDRATDALVTIAMPKSNTAVKRDDPQ